MRFNWQKKGLIFDPTARFSWMQSHAQVPTAIDLNDRLRIYFTCRPEPDEFGKYVSLISFIEVNKDSPKDILYIHDKPVLEPGEYGTFDHYGTMPGCIIKQNDKLFLYYTGWSREYDLPYTTSIGIAISDDGGVSFRRVGKGPLLSKNLNDPFLINGPFVMIKNKLFHMWYSSCTHWVTNGDAKDPVYLIKHAVSEDGLSWQTEKDSIIEKVISDEAQNRPMIFEYDSKYYLFFSYRKGKDFKKLGNGYRLAMACSNDLVKWERSQDKFLTGDTNDTWDNEMQAYPFLISNGEKLFLFYNGNEFGKNGFGYAETTINHSS